MNGNRRSTVGTELVQEKDNVAFDTDGHHGTKKAGDSLIAMVTATPVTPAEGTPQQGVEEEPPLRARDCSAEQLAAWLMRNRFDGDEMALTEFLLEAVSSLPSAQAISDRLMGGGDRSGGCEEENNESETAAAVVATVRQEQSLPPPGPPPTLAAQTCKPLLHGGPVETSFTVPRCKLRVSWHGSGEDFQMVGVDKQGHRLVLTAGAVQQVIIFPKPQDCHRPMGKSSGKAAAAALATTNMVLVVLKRQRGACTYKGKIMEQVCFQLPSERPVWKDKTEEECSDEPKDHTRLWIDVLESTLLFRTKEDVDGEGSAGRPPLVRIYNPANSGTANEKRVEWKFVSSKEDGLSTTVQGMPFLPCTFKTSTGHLFPTKAGLLFFRPALWISRADLHSLACRPRPSSRYMDLTVRVRAQRLDEPVSDEDEGIYKRDSEDDDDDDLELYEFTNIHRGELQIMNHYIHNVLIPSMARDCGQVVPSSSSSSVGGGDDEQEEAEDDDDDNARPLSHPNSGSRRSRRQASRRAARVNRHEAAMLVDGNGEEGEEDEDYDDEHWNAQFASVVEEDEEDEEMLEEEFEDDDGDVDVDEDATESEEDDDDDDDDKDDEDDDDKDDDVQPHNPRKRCRQDGP